MAGNDEALSDTHFLPSSYLVTSDSCRRMNDSGGNANVCQEAKNILDAAPKLSNSCSGHSQCERRMKSTDTLENSMLPTEEENVSNRNSNSSEEDNSCHPKPKDPGVRQIDNLPSPRNTLALNLDDGNSKPSSDATRVKILDKESENQLNVIGDEDQPTDDNNLNTRTDDVISPTVAPRPNANPKTNSQEQEVKRIPLESIEYLNQMLSTSYSKNWKHIANIHGWPADKIYVFTQRCKDHREDPFEKMMYTDKFQIYTLKDLLEDLRKLPRLDMLRDKDNKIW